MDGVIAGIVVVGLIIVGVVVKSTMDKRAGTRVAAAHGFEYVRDKLDKPQLRQLFPSLAARSLSEGFRAADLPGTPVLFKDVRDSSRDPYTDSNSRDPSFTSAIVDLAIDVPSVSLHRAGLLLRAAQRMGLNEVTIGHDEFDKAFVVRSDDEEGARRVLDHDLVASLLDGRGADVHQLQLRGRHALITWKGYRVALVADRMTQASDLVAPLRPRGRS